MTFSWEIATLGCHYSSNFPVTVALHYESIRSSTAYSLLRTKFSPSATNILTKHAILCTLASHSAQDVGRLTWKRWQCQAQFLAKFTCSAKYFACYVQFTLLNCPLFHASEVEQRQVKMQAYKTIHSKYFNNTVPGKSISAGQLQTPQKSLAELPKLEASIKSSEPLYGSLGLQ